VVAKHHGVLFYVAAPFTSIDFSIPSGEHIVIEERPEREMSHVANHRIAASGLFVGLSPVLSPFFLKLACEVSNFKMLA
jgi:methylthioribose-1-phosphate isomerase